MRQIDIPLASQSTGVWGLTGAEENIRDKQATCSRQYPDVEER
jgi:hypothetical protein